MVVKLISAKIEKISYSPLSMKLQIVFRNERCIYEFEDVREELWYALRRASNPDNFFNSRIASCHKYHVIDRHKSVRA